MCIYIYIYIYIYESVEENCKLATKEMEQYGDILENKRIKKQS